MYKSFTRAAFRTASKNQKWSLNGGRKGEERGGKYSYYEIAHDSLINMIIK